MCGIAGIWNRGDEPAGVPILERMMDRMAHRGPDDRGTWADGAVALGHLRLSILDLSSRGHQPFVTADGQGVLTYNGEVYNYPDLRVELEREGVRFQSTSDTEVVLYALHRWGPEAAIPRFDGMFGFAYLDRRRGALWLARDRLGIKPVYVARPRGGLVFASEIKALLVHPEVPCQPDKHALCVQLLLGRLDREVTPFEGIEALRPGTHWKVTRDGVEKTTYFDVARDLDVDRLCEAGRQSPEGLLADFEQTLRESVRIHLASDAPVATMCSGGVDSSLITAYTRDFRPEVIGYVADAKGTVSEGERAQEVGRHLGVSIRQVDVDLEGYLRTWPEATWYGDQPNTHANDIPMLAVARACRADGVKVVLTGEGSDELFGGYGWQQRSYQLAYQLERDRAPAIGSSSPRPRRPIGRLPRRALRKLAALLPRRFQPESMLNPLGLLAGAQAASFALTTLPALDPERQLRGLALWRKLEPAGTPAERAFLAHCLDDLYGHLEGLLRRNDRMGMAASIETRVPFLENRLIELGMHAPFWAKLRDGEGKWVVKAAADKRLPRQIVHAPKLGFTFVEEAFRYGLPLLSGGVSAELFRWTQATTRSLQDVLRQDRIAIWCLVSIELWARLYLRGESSEELAERLVRNARDLERGG